MTEAMFTVVRTSPNEAVHESISVWAENADEARRVAEYDGWCVDSCSLSYHQPGEDAKNAR